VIDFLKGELRPSSPFLMFACLAAATLWIWLRPASLRARRLLLAIVVGYWLLSTRTGSNLLLAGLTAGLHPIQTSTEAGGADVIVALSGGGWSYRDGGVVIGVPVRSTVLRALEAARLFRIVDARRVIASGGQVDPTIDLKPEGSMMRDVLIEAGVPRERIVVETRARTTREQARYVRPLLEREGAHRFLLVTSPTHMRRAVAVFQAQGFDPIPAPAPIDSDQMPPPSWLVPNEEALHRSDLAVYDYAALVYYWSTGFLMPGPPAAR
jgi:uncharacterized SAM-binding protein YcdF (DUF218 family)